ncbi:Rhodanese-like domain-containing protein, partial [Dimargaris cristalligena]
TLVIDVREPAEISATGLIPTSQAIPLGHVEQALQLSPQQFQATYGFSKPQPEDHLVFYCRSGVRAGTAMDIAQRLGFKSARNYKGSWLEYSGR